MNLNDLSDIIIDSISYKIESSYSDFEDDNQSSLLVDAKQSPLYNEINETVLKKINNEKAPNFVRENSDGLDQILTGARPIDLQSEDVPLEMDIDSQIVQSDYEQRKSSRKISRNGSRNLSFADNFDDKINLNKSRKHTRGNSFAH